MKPWGCPKCGNDVGLCRETGRDEEGYRVRLRQCTKCGTTWATEETPIAVSAFYARNASGRRARREWERKQGGRRICAWCQGEYPAGTYRRHCAESKRHIAALIPRKRAGDRYEAMRYHREWQRQKREVA